MLDDLGLDTVDVLAFSAGCRTAIALPLAHPDRVRRGRWGQRDPAEIAAVAYSLLPEWMRQPTRPW